MKIMTMMTATVLIISSVSQAGAVGCPSGAAAGAAAGHFVGKGHAVLGGVAGCAVGHHEKKKKERQQARQHDEDQRRNGNKNDQGNY